MNKFLRQRDKNTVIDQEKLHDYFKNLNRNGERNDTDFEIPDSDDERENTFLNGKITDNVFFKAVKHLKNGRAQGYVMIWS